MDIKQEQIDGRRRLSSIWGRTRTFVGKSQEQMADEMGVSRKTIQNWEKGASTPDLEQTFRWFRILGISPLVYLWEYLHPDMKNINAKTEVEVLRKSLLNIVEELPEEGMRQLLYILYGDHGSSPRSILHLMNAYLQTPMKDRVTQAGIIVRNYEMARRKGDLTDTEHVQPDLELLHNAIDKGEEAFVRNDSGYINEL